MTTTPERVLMKPIAILANSRRIARCRSCGAVIEWATVAATNAQTPFNAPIVLEATLALDVSLEVARVDMTQTTSHFASCPQASQWRRRRR